MQSVLPVFSASVVSATLAVVPAQTSAEDRAVPAPAAVWPAGPLELVMAFPAPADPQWTPSFIGKSIAYFDPPRYRYGCEDDHTAARRDRPDPPQRHVDHARGGLAGGLGEAGVRDLIAFLTSAR
jgi:hypothetical protein